MLNTIIFIGITLLLFFYGVSIYNRLIQLQNFVEEAWSGIDVQLKKRYNLIPNLMETVKGYASHEKETFQEVTEARSQAQQADTLKEQQQAENKLNNALMNLFAVAEQYPELKANENFLDLQNELSVIESDIEKSRRYYNGTVRDKNILLQSFPSNLVGNLFGFTESAFFEIDEPDHRANPQVSFQ